MDKIGFLFAGQGSQYIGMGKDLYESFPESKEIFDKANEVLGFDLKQLCFEGLREDLKPTDISQPAIVATTIACYEAFKSKVNIRPLYAAGLSLGEYTALIAMGAIRFSTGIELVRKRGKIMEEAAKKYPGKMAAVIDLPMEKLNLIRRKTDIELANVNCPGQIVLSGSIESIDKARTECLAAGAKKFIELEVSGGFHSPLLFEASGKLKALLDDIHLALPKAEVISNYTATPESRAEDIKQNLVYQIYSTVRWEESVRFMLSQGVNKFYEFGPGKVLKGLMRKIEPNTEVICIEKAEDIVALSA